jgi:hypothetical protein
VIRAYPLIVTHGTSSYLVWGTSALGHRLHAATPSVTNPPGFYLPPPPPPLCIALAVLNLGQHEGRNEACQRGAAALGKRRYGSDRRKRKACRSLIPNGMDVIRMLCTPSPI